MFSKIKARKLVMTCTQIIHLIGPSAIADYNCPPGQPEACINEVKSRNQSFRKEIDGYVESLGKKDEYIKSCWERYAITRADFENSDKMYERLTGKLESLRAELLESKKLYNCQYNQVQIIKQIQSIHLNYFREIIQALSVDINQNGTAKQLTTYRNDLVLMKSSSTIENEKMAIDVTLGMIDEIMRIISVKDGAGSGLQSRLHNEISKFDSKLTELTKKIVDHALNGAELNEVSFSGLISVASVNANTLFSIYKKNLERIKLDIHQTEKEKKVHLDNSISGSKEASNLSNGCLNKEEYYEDILPQKIKEIEEKINQNWNYLNNDGCRKEYCRKIPMSQVVGRGL